MKNGYTEENNMKRKDPILNNDRVTAHYTDLKGQNPNVMHNQRFSDLKNKFISGELAKNGIQITKIYLPRTNTNYFVAYKPTGGFIFKKQR